MESIKFSNKEICITLDNESEAEKLTRWAESQLLKELVSCEGNVFRYDISEYKDKFYPIMRLLSKIVFDTEYLDKEVYSSAFHTDKYDYVIDIRIRGGKLFRVTPINSDGTLGCRDFGVHKYSELFRVSKLNETGEFWFLAGRYHVGEFSNCELQLGGDGDYCCREVLIEIGDVQF